MRSLLVLLALALGSCAPAANAPQTRIVAYGPTPQARHENALSQAGGAVMSERMMLDLEKQTGKIATDLPSRVKGLPEKLKAVPLWENAENAALWWAGDESALAQRLLDQGVQFVLLRRDVAPSVDRGGAVISRLYHDDDRARFMLVSADSEYLLYAVSDKVAALAPQAATFITSTLRTMLKGEKPRGFPSIKAPRGNKWNLMATLRLPGGRELAYGLCVREELGECVVELANDLEREHRRYAEWYGMPKLSDSIDNMLLELHLVTDRAKIYATSEDDLNEFWEMGIDGGLILNRETGEVAMIPGAVSYTRAYRDADKLLRTAAREGHMDSLRPWRDPGYDLEKIRTQHYLDWPGRGIIPLYRGVPPVPMEVVDIQSIERSILLSGEWYLRNLHPNDQPLPFYKPGQVTYKMWPAENRYSDEYNIVRHALATWNLVQAYQIEPRPEFIEGARRALDFTLSFRKDEENRSFIAHENNVKLGSVVVAMMGMIDLARATGTTEYDELLNRFGEFTVFMQEPSGRFDPYYVEADHPYAEEVNDIVPGEAALALVMLYEYTGDKKWLAPLPKFFEYYKPWWKERVAKIRPEAPSPHETYDTNDRLELVQFGPWSVMAANAYHRVTGDEEVAKFGLEVARWMVETYEYTGDDSPWPDYVGGYYKLPGELPAMQAFCYGEGTAAAYALALRADPSQAPFFEKATRETVRFGLMMQFDDLQTYPFTRGDEVRGGTRYTMNETKVRIDYVYHAQSTLVQYRDAALTDPNLPPEVKRSPLRDELEAAQKKQAEAAAAAAAAAGASPPTSPSPTPPVIPGTGLPPKTP